MTNSNISSQSSEPTYSTPTPVVIDATKLPARIRWRRAFRALARVLRDPEQTDQVLVFSTYANAGTMPRRSHRFLDDPRGRRLYRERRAIDGHTIDLDALGNLPEGTLGRAYADFLRSRGLTSDVFEGTPEDVPDPGMAYIIQRLRQTHDLWHVVTGYDTDPASEVALQAFTFGQLGAPSAGILALLGTLRGMSIKADLVRDVARAHRLGRRAEKLAIFPWEDYWSTPLLDVRRMLRLPVVPHDAERLAREVRAVIASMSPAPAPSTTAPPASTTATDASTAHPTTEADHTAAGATEATHATDATASTANPSATDTTSRRFIDIAHASGASRARRHRRALRRAWRAARREIRAAA